MRGEVSSPKATTLTTSEVGRTGKVIVGELLSNRVVLVPSTTVLRSGRPGRATRADDERDAGAQEGGSAPRRLSGLLADPPAGGSAHRWLP